MRFFWWKQPIMLLTSLLLACLLFLGVRGTNALPLSSLAGAHTYYTYSPSSQAQIQTQLLGADALHLQGESVQVSLTLQQKRNLPAYADSVLKQFSATLVLVEQTGDVTSYYAYSPKLGRGLLLQGKQVNLHIAFSLDRCTVGTPLIFGGF